MNILRFHDKSRAYGLIKIYARKEIENYELIINYSRILNSIVMLSLGYSYEAESNFQSYKIYYRV